MADDEQEARRRIQISIRIKAARLLAGKPKTEGKKKGIVAIPVAEMLQMERIKAEKITKNRLEELEQMTSGARDGEMRAIIDALGLPAEWFDGLYMADRGTASTALGSTLMAMAEQIQAPQPGSEEPDSSPPASDRRRPGGEAGR